MHVPREISLVKQIIPGLNLVIRINKDHQTTVLGLLNRFLLLFGT